MLPYFVSFSVTTQMGKSESVTLCRGLRSNYESSSDGAIIPAGKKRKRKEKRKLREKIIFVQSSSESLRI